LWHSKSVFPVVFLGKAAVERLKALGRELNSQLPNASHQALAL
jgi:hypothetical protein